MTAKQADYTTEYFTKVGTSLGHIDMVMQGYRDVSVELTGMSIRGPIAQGGEFLATLRGYDSDGMKVVAFHGAASLSEVFIGICARLGNGSLKWKEDQFGR